MASLFSSKNYWRGLLSEFKYLGVWLIQDQETELVETSDVRNLALLIWVPNQCCIFKQDLATAVSQVHNFI